MRIQDRPPSPPGRRPHVLLIAEPSGEARLADEIRTLGYSVTPVAADAALALATAAELPADIVLAEALPDLASAAAEVGRSAATELGIPLVLIIQEDQEEAALEAATDSVQVLLTAPVTRGKLDRSVELAWLRHSLEERIARSEERYRLLFERNVAGVLRESVDGRVIECNPALARMLGYDGPAELAGLEADRLFADDGDATAYRALLAQAGQVAGHETRMVRRDGTEIWILDNSTLVEDPEGGPAEIVRTLVEVTDRKAREDDLAHMAYHDALTGLGNRRLLRIQADQVLALADRRGGRAALLFMDVVDFKDINDEHGHRVGDEVLREVGRRLSANLRTADVSARTGGDEFAVLLAHVDDSRTARVGAERLNERLSEPMEVEGVTVAIESRIGVALFPDDGTDLDSLMAMADTALTTAKAQEGPIIVMANPDADGADGGSGP
ncbi:MAG TPA: sensor domain-containing diguanylate cyclase [Longimicrobiales bacterium]